MVNITLNLKEQDKELNFGSRLQDIFLYELTTKENLLNMLNYIKQEYYRETNIEQNFSLSFYSQSGKLDIFKNLKQDVITIDSELIYLAFNQNIELNEKEENEKYKKLY